MSRLRLALPALLVAALVLPLQFTLSDEASASCSPRAARIALDHTTVVGGRSAKATVTISCAPRQRAKVTLRADTGIVVPRYVYVAAGKRSKSFTVRTKLTAVTTKGRVRATLARRTASATLTRKPAACYPLSIAVTPNRLIGGARATGKVTLTCLSTTPKTVTLAGTNKVKLPSSVVVPAGRQSATFPVTTGITYGKTSGLQGTSTGYARARLNGRTKSAPVTMKNVSTSCAMRSLSLPSIYYRGGTGTGTVTLGCTAPVGIPVRLETDDQRVKVPASITVPRGKASATFPITTKITVPRTLQSDVYDSYMPTVIARDPIKTLGKTMTVRPGLYGISLYGSDPNDFTLTLSLTGPAAAGTVVKLSTSDAGVTYPGQVTVPEGTSSIRVSPTSVRPGADDRSVTVNAALGGRSLHKSRTLMHEYADGDPFELWYGGSPTWTVYGNAEDAFEIDLGRPAGPQGTSGSIAVSSGASTITLRESTFTIPGGAQVVRPRVDFGAVTEGTEHATITVTIGSVTQTIPVTHEPKVRLEVPPGPAVPGKPFDASIVLSGPSDRNLDVRLFTCLNDIDQSSSDCTDETVTLESGQVSMPISAFPSASTLSIRFAILFGDGQRIDYDAIPVDRSQLG